MISISAREGSEGRGNEIRTESVVDLVVVNLGFNLPSECAVGELHCLPRPKAAGVPVAHFDTGRGQGTESATDSTNLQNHHASLELQDATRRLRQYKLRPKDVP